MATADSHNAAQDMSGGAHSQHVDASNENVPGDSNSNGVHSDASSLVDHVHEKSAPAAKVTKKEKFKRHCGRFWWWYLIAGIILLAILLPILFTVIVPAIVQAIVNSQQLPVHSGFFKAVSPSELLVSLNTTLNTDIFSVQVDALTMYLSQDSDVDKWPFSNFTLPAMHVKGDTYAILNKQACPITNSTQLTSWVANLFDNPTVDLHVEGNPGIHMGALHSTPHLSKTLTLPALNKLEGKAIDNLELILEGDGEGNNIQGSLNLPNNGILGLDFGNLTLGLSSGSLAIGHVTLNNVALYPGNNSVAFKGFLNLKTLFSNLGTVLASQAQALSKGNIDLNATATSVIVNGEHIPYVENVLTQRTLTFSINAVTLVADVLASLLHGNKKSLDTLIQDIVGNKTLMNEISNNWNRTGGAQELSQIGANQMNRLKSRESLTWELLKLSMKMNRNKF